MNNILSEHNRKSQEVAGIKVVFPIFIRECELILQEIKGGCYGEHSSYGDGGDRYETIKRGLADTGITTACDLGAYLVNVCKSREEIPKWCEILLSRSVMVSGRLRRLPEDRQ